MDMNGDDMTDQRDKAADRHPREEEQLVLAAREVEFDWSQLPWHWIPGEPVTTHTEPSRVSCTHCHLCATG